MTGYGLNQNEKQRLQKTVKFGPFSTTATLYIIIFVVYYLFLLFFVILLLSKLDGWIFNDNFSSKLNMRNNVYRKLFKSEFPVTTTFYISIKNKRKRYNLAKRLNY